MTRHGIVVETSTAGPQPPVTDPNASMVIVDADGAAFSRLPCRQHRAEAQRSRLSASIPALPGDGRAIADISRKSKSL
ncbi:hypothetical protein FJW08_07995 [Mesorhizobium sp. B3-2-1]|nr:hypothetical protein FJW08_07995 [Mesorhizobium sp. B3-2-1]